jgi:hypothetical protein
MDFADPDHGQELIERASRRAGGTWVIEEEALSRIARYRETAETLRRLANAVQFDFRRREQLLALAAGFDRAAERIEALPPAD